MSQANLPVQLTSFIGRPRELQDVERLISEARLVTLTGAGGCGKTRLAIQIGNNLSGSFADGVWLADLLPLSEPELVPQYVAQTLGLHPTPDQSIHDLLLNFARSKQILLILDNCEHLITICNNLARQLLAETTALNILATSRQPLLVSGEMIYPVQGLALPTNDSGTALDLQDLTRYDAVQLFVERARAISPNFVITRENAASIIEICRRLDGIPLALELASARVKVLTPAQIAARLDDRFVLLDSGQLRGTVAHHQTLRAAIDWSYDLLMPEERILLRRLAVFDSGCTLDIAESVCSGEGIIKEHTLDLISSLADKSLIIAETSNRAEARYRLLESIREYALERLREAGEEVPMRNRHLDFFVARAEEIAPKVQDTRYRSLWQNWLDGEVDNMRSALAWSLESERIEYGLRLMVALIEYSRTRGHFLAGNWLEPLLARAEETIAPTIRAHAFIYASYRAALQGEAAAAASHALAAMALYDTAGEAPKPILADALLGIGMAAQATGDFVAAQQVCERAASLYRELGNLHNLSITLIGQAVIELGLGNYVKARGWLDEGLAVSREVGEPHHLALAFNVLGDLERLEHSYQRAQAAYEHGLERLRQIGATRDEAAVLHNLAHAHLHQGHLNEARLLFRESMLVRKGEGDKQGLAECLIGFGAVAAASGMPARAACLLAAAVALGGKALLTQWPAERMEYDYYLSAVRAQLTEPEIETEQREGRMMTMEESIEFALSLPLLSEKTVVQSKDQPSILTVREREMAALIGQGLTNGEISAQLVLSKRTVEKHVANILSKLTMRSRAQIVRWAIEHHLTSPSSS
jgi:predicted ATPase/DNA-binding CsgD family transcriptional regulator